MRAVDIFYVESEDISCVSIKHRGLRAGQKLIDENGKVYEIYGLNTNGRALLKGITQALVRGKFEGDTVTLIEDNNG